jgi:hypothetical protein
MCRRLVEITEISVAKFSAAKCGSPFFRRTDAEVCCTAREHFVVVVLRSALVVLLVYVVKKILGYDEKILILENRTSASRKMLSNALQL